MVEIGDAIVRTLIKLHDKKLRGLGAKKYAVLQEIETDTKRESFYAEGATVGSAFKGIRQQREYRKTRGEYTYDEDYSF